MSALDFPLQVVFPLVVVHLKLASMCPMLRSSQVARKPMRRFCTGPVPTKDERGFWQLPQDYAAKQLAYSLRGHRPDDQLPTVDVM